VGGRDGKLALTSSIWKKKYSMIGIELHSHSNVENQITYVMIMYLYMIILSLSKEGDMEGPWAHTLKKL
jgi:hypothetical protein